MIYTPSSCIVCYCTCVASNQDITDISVCINCLNAVCKSSEDASVNEYLEESVSSSINCDKCGESAEGYVNISVCNKHFKNITSRNSINSHETQFVPSEMYEHDKNDMKTIAVTPIQQLPTIKRDYRQLGTLKINSFCCLTYPCQHTVENMETGETKMMFGDKIFIALRDQGISDKHFDIYREYVRKRENPTEEEIAAQKAFEEKYRVANENAKKSEEKWRKNREEAYITRASSRLERLKQRHNVSV